MTHTQVKSLEWQATASGKFWHAENYSIHMVNGFGVYVLRGPSSVTNPFDSLEAAKAAAQADYEARILSALVPAPAVPDDVAGLVKRARRTLLYECSGECSSLADDLADALEAQAAELEQTKAENTRLRTALSALHHAVCGETGFAEAVRLNSGLAYPWPALDIADELARSALQPTGDA